MLPFLQLHPFFFFSKFTFDIMTPALVSALNMVMFRWTSVGSSPPKRKGAISSFLEEFSCFCGPRGGSNEESQPSLKLVRNSTLIHKLVSSPKRE